MESFVPDSDRNCRYSNTFRHLTTSRRNPGQRILSEFLGSHRILLGSFALGWSVTLSADKLKWLDGAYNCLAFFEKFMCKHIIGMAVRLNYYKLPTVAKGVKVGEKRRRGRPLKAKTALLIQ